MDTKPTCEAAVSRVMALGKMVAIPGEETGSVIHIRLDNGLIVPIQQKEGRSAFIHYLRTENQKVLEGLESTGGGFRLY